MCITCYFTLSAKASFHTAFKQLITKLLGVFNAEIEKFPRLPFWQVVVSVIILQMPS